MSVLNNVESIGDDLKPGWSFKSTHDERVEGVHAVILENHREVANGMDISTWAFADWQSETNSFWK